MVKQTTILGKVVTMLLSTITINCRRSGLSRDVCEGVNV